MFEKNIASRLHDEIMSDRQFEKEVVKNIVPNLVDFGRNPYHEDKAVYDVFTDMLITETKELLCPYALRGKRWKRDKEDMTSKAVCSLWKTAVTAGSSMTGSASVGNYTGPPLPCGPPLYVGPIGPYPASTKAFNDSAWRAAANRNGNRSTRMSETAERGKDGMGGSVCKVPVAYDVRAIRLGAAGEALPDTPEFDQLWRSLVTIDARGDITVTSLRKDVCASSTNINPLLVHGFKLIVTPYLMKPYGAPSDYRLSSTTALPVVDFKVSWTWLSYNPVNLTAILGQRSHQDDKYNIAPFVSRCLDQYRRGGEATKKRIEDEQNKKQKHAPFYYMSGYAWGYNLKYTVTCEDGQEWPYAVDVNQETGVVQVAAPTAQEGATHVRRKGLLKVEVVTTPPDPAGGKSSVVNGAGKLTNSMGFPKTFPIEIQWMTPAQWFDAVNRDAARSAGNPMPDQPPSTQPQTGDDYEPNTSSPDAPASSKTGGCAQPQPPLGRPNKYDVAMANHFNDLGKPSCTTFHAEASGSGGVAIAQFAASTSVTAATGCEQIVAQMSNYKSFSQSLSCQFNSVKASSTAFSAAYQSFDIEIEGSNIVRKGGSQTVKSNINQSVEMKGSLRSVNQQSLSAVSANAIKSTANSNIKWANGSGSTPHGSRCIKQMTQVANQVTSAQNINNVMQDVYAGIYADTTIRFRVGGDNIIEGKQLFDSNQQQTLVINTFVTGVLTSKSTQVMNNQITDGLSSKVVDESKGALDSLADLVGAQNAWMDYLIIGGIVLGVVGAIVGAFVYIKTSKNEQSDGGSSSRPKPVE